MFHLTPSPLVDAGEVLVGISLPMFVAALIAAFGDRFKQSVVRFAPPTRNGRPGPSYCVRRAKEQGGASCVRHL